MELVMKMCFCQLMPGICLCLLWHQQLAGTHTPHPSTSENTETAKTIKMREQMFFLSSVSLRVCQVLISALTGERDEASLTHAMWVKNPDDFFFLLAGQTGIVRQQIKKKKRQRKEDLGVFSCPIYKKNKDKKSHIISSASWNLFWLASLMKMEINELLKC